MINTKEIFAGAGAGAAFPPVLGLAKDVILKHCAFDSTLESTEFKVKILKELIPKIEGHSTKLGGNRGVVVDPLRGTVDGGSTLTGELSGISKWNILKAHYTGKLVKVDKDIKKDLEMLQVQAVIDGQETLIVAKETLDVAKANSVVADQTLVVSKANSVVADETLDVVKATSGVAKVALGVAEATTGVVHTTLGVAKETSDVAKETLGKTNLALLIAEETAGLAINIERRQDATLDMIRRLEASGLGEKVDSLNEAAALGATLLELDTAVSRELIKSANRRKQLFRLFCPAIERLRAIFELIERKTAQHKDLPYIPNKELYTFNEQIKMGVVLVHNSSKVVEWTEALKIEYFNKFRELEKTLERLYSRLNGIHPFKWNTGMCGSSWTSGLVMHEDSFSRQ